MAGGVCLLVVSFGRCCCAAAAAEAACAAWFRLFLCWVSRALVSSPATSVSTWVSFFFCVGGKYRQKSARIAVPHQQASSVPIPPPLPARALLSLAEQDLINKLLDADPKRRLTAEEVLKHPWMQKTANLSKRPMVHAAENLRGFHRGRMRLKACLLAVMSGLAGSATYGSDPKSTVGSRTGALKWMDIGGKVKALFYICMHVDVHVLRITVLRSI